MRAIGILGGSFDPIHVAHLAMADAFARTLALDELRFLPASRPWQKGGLAASAGDRLAMIEAALAHHSVPIGTYVVDTRELDRSGRTYTIDTLQAMRTDVGPSVSLAFLMGADQLVRLDTWNDWRGLWDQAHLAAITRPGFDVESLPADVRDEWVARAGDAEAIHRAACGRSHLVTGFAMDVSATRIRRAIAEDAGPADGEVMRLVPPVVLDYIRAHHLYRS